MMDCRRKVRGKSWVEEGIATVLKRRKSLRWKKMSFQGRTEREVRISGANGDREGIPDGRRGKRKRATAIGRINTGDNEKLLVVGAERPCSRVRGEKFM